MRTKKQGSEVLQKLGFNSIRKPTTVFFLKFNTAPELEISDQLKNRLFLSYFIVKIDFHVQILQSTVAMFTVEQI